MLGQREPEVYGKLTLQEIIQYTETHLAKKCECVWFQSNVEGEIVTRIQELTSQNFDALVINPGAYSHTSVAILDALHIISIPVIEVHLSNTHRREEFRQTKLTAKASTIIMEGLGKNSYLLAIQSQLL